MDWNLKQIPKQVFFYWGSSKMSFLRWMTIASFRYHNPDWRILLYKPIKRTDVIPWCNKMFDNDGTQFLDYTNSFHRLGVEMVDFDFGSIGINNDLNEIHKSDLIRYHLLSQIGGVYADMDILWIKPMTELTVNHEAQDQARSRATYVYFGQVPGEPREAHAIGFLMSTPGGRFYTDVFRRACERLHLSSQEYQAYGADLLNERFLRPVIEDYGDVGYIGKEAVYAIDHDDREFLYQAEGLHLLSESSVGIHWYGGSEYVGQLIYTLNHANFLKYDNQGTLLRFMRDQFADIEEMYLR